MSHSELQLSNQLCFMVHRLDRAIAARYRPLLGQLGLTYPQYLVMLALWEEDRLAVGELCRRLELDTGTMSPLLKRLATAGLVEKRRGQSDERSVCVSLTAKGRALKEQALPIPGAMAGCLLTSQDEYYELRTILTRLLERLDKPDCQA